MATHSESTRKQGWPRLLAIGILVVVGSLLVPLVVVTSGVHTAVTDTDRFVDAYAPLAENADVRSYVTNEVTTVVEERVDIDALLSGLFDRIPVSGGSRSDAALRALQAPVTAGMKSLVRETVSRFVSSDQFASAWRSALRASHTQVVSVLNEDPDGLFSLGSTGTLSVQLGPIVAAAREALIERGLPFASSIPEVTKTIPVATIESVSTIRLVYRLLDWASSWLVWVALALLVAAVVVSRRRWKTATIALLGVAAACAVFVIALAVVHAVAPGTVDRAIDGTTIPGPVVSAVLAASTDTMREVWIWIGAVSLAAAVVLWSVSPASRARWRRLAGRRQEERPQETPA